MRMGRAAPMKLITLRIRMNEELFAELIASIKEGGAILRGERDASRSFSMGPEHPEPPSNDGDRT